MARYADPVNPRLRGRPLSRYRDPLGESVEIADLRAGIEARLAALPAPSSAVRFAVGLELAHAYDRAVTLAVQAGARIPGRCALCGVDLDQSTVGCGNCSSRHWQRAKTAAAAA